MIERGGIRSSLNNMPRKPVAKSKVSKAAQSPTGKGKRKAAPDPPSKTPKNSKSALKKPKTKADQDQPKREIQQNAKILSIPTELQVEILSYLRILDQINAVRVCKSWKQLICGIATLRKTRYPPFIGEEIPYIPGRAGVHQLFQNFKILCTIDYNFEGIERIYLQMSTFPTVGVEEIKENGYWLENPLQAVEITDSVLLDDPFLSPFGFEVAGPAKKLDSTDDRLKKQRERFEASRQKIETAILLDTASRWEEPYIDSMSFRKNENLSIRQILEDHVNEICWKVNSGELDLAHDNQIMVYFEAQDAKQFLTGKWAWSVIASIYAPS
ncbi:hypothetical protein AA313_de0200135 [Arthrobotrys entomopaga]|nr:hypothetical protein AA313_de0200135 [Arthrobotrys entomopaga]